MSTRVRHDKKPIKKRERELGSSVHCLRAGSCFCGSMSFNVKVHPLTQLPSKGVELTQSEAKIYTCAIEAGISDAQWKELILAVGAEVIEDILELYLEDFNKCNFKPLLSVRIENFLARLWNEPMETAAVALPTPLPTPTEVEVPEAAPIPVPHASPRPLQTSTLCKHHKPSKKRREDLSYWFLHAVSDGCKGCVKILVEEMKVDINATSETHKWTAMDFAEFYEQQEMKAYLELLS